MTTAIVDKNVTKGNLSGSNEIKVDGSGKLFGAGLTLSINDGSIKQGKLDTDLSNKIDDIENKVDTTHLESNYLNKTQITNSYYDKPTVDTKLDGKVNIGGNNLTNINTWQTTLQIGTGTINGTLTDNQSVTGTTVKNYVESKKYITIDDIDTSIVDGNITKGDLKGDKFIQVTNGENRLIGDEDLTITIKDKSITQDKLDESITNKIAEIDNKANKAELDNYSKIDASNINVDKYKEKLGIDNLATIESLDDYYTKTESDKRYYTKTQTNDLLMNKANVSGNNLKNIDTWQTNLKIGTGTIVKSQTRSMNHNNETVTGQTVLDYLEANYYSKTDIDDKINNIKVDDGIDGVEKEYVDNGDKNTLDSSKEYTDSTIEAVIKETNDRSDKNDILTLEKANEYTDSKIGDAVIQIADNAIAIEELNNRVNDNSMRIDQNTQAIQQNSQRIDMLDDKFSNAVAMSNALSAMPQSSIAGKSMFTAGIGTYSSKQAIAIGYSKMSDNQKHVLKFGLSSNVSGHKKLSAGLGYGFHF